MHRSRNQTPTLRGLTPILLALAAAAPLFAVDPATFNPFRDTKEFLFLYTGGLLGLSLGARLVFDPLARKASLLLLPLLPLAGIALWRYWETRIGSDLGAFRETSSVQSAYLLRLYGFGAAALLVFWAAASQQLSLHRARFFGLLFILLAGVEVLGVGVEMTGQALGREWRPFLGSVALESGPEESKTAFYGSLGNSNFLAGCLAILFFAALPSLGGARSINTSRFRAVLPPALLVAVFVTILACRSKGALLALAIGGLVFAIGNGVLRQRSKQARNPGSVVPVKSPSSHWRKPVLALVVGVFAFLLFFGKGVREDWLSTLSLRGESLSKRVFLAYTGLHLMKESPWFGIGPGEFRIRFLGALSEILASPDGPAFRARVENLKSFKPVHLHNDPLELLVEWGIVGYGAGLLFVLTVVLLAGNRMRTDPLELALMRLAFLSGFAAAVGYSLFEFPFHLPPHLALAAMLLGLAAAPRTAAPTRSAFSPVGLAVGFLVLVLSGLPIAQGLRLCGASHLAHLAWTNPKSKISEVNQAHDQARRASLLDPGNAEIGMLLGQFQWRIQKKPGEANNTFRKFAAIGDDPLFTLLQAQIALEDKRLQDALRAIAPLAGIADFLPGVGYIQGQIARDLDRPEDAAEAFLRDLRATARFPNPERVNPDLPGLYLKYGDVLEVLGRYREAVWQYEAHNRMIAERGSNIPVGYLRLGQIYRDRFSDYETARSYFQKALESAEKHSTSAQIQIIREEIRNLNEWIRQLRSPTPPPDSVEHPIQE